MIPARHNTLYRKFFEWYISFMLWRNFDKVSISSDVKPKNTSMLVIGNHFSWWDGLFVGHANRKLFKKKFHVMMLEEQLRPRMFLNKLGAFSIDKRSRSVLTSLDYASSLLNDPKHLLLIYPQGRLYSMHQQPMVFERGWMRIAEKCEANFQLVFCTALIDYFARRRPQLSMYLTEYPYRTGDSATELEKAYNDFYQQCVAQQQET